MTQLTSLFGPAVQFASDAARVAFGGRPAKPFIVGLTINTICNLRCSYCFIGRDAEHFPEGFAKQGLSGDEIKQILRNVRRDTGFLILTGGEPFLHQDLHEILRYAKEELRFSNISVATNGMFLLKKREILRFIDRLGISYDFTRAREYPKQMEKVLADLVQLRKEHALPPVHFTMTVLRDEDQSPFAAFAEYCKEHNFRIWLQPERVHGDFTEWKWFRDLMQTLAKQHSADLFLSDLSVVESFVESEDKRRCLPELRMHIKEDGQLAYPCHRLEHLAPGGSALESTPMELWRAAEQANGRFPNEKCQGCGFTCYFETAGLYRHPLSFARKAAKHLTSQDSG